MYEDEIREGIEGVLKWFTFKERPYSVGEIHCPTYDDALDTQDVFDFYADQGCFDWQRPTMNTFTRQDNRPWHYCTEKFSKRESKRNLGLTKFEYSYQDINGPITVTAYFNNKPFDTRIVERPNEEFKRKLRNCR